MLGHTGVVEPNGTGRYGQLGRRAARVLIGALILLGASAIAVTVSTGAALMGFRLLFALLAVCVFSLTALQGVALARRENDPMAPIGAVAVIVSALSTTAMIASFMTLPIGDTDNTGPEGLFRMAEIGLVCSLALGNVSMMLAGRRHDDRRVVTMLLAAAVGLTVGLCVMVTLAIAQTNLEIDDSFWRMVGVTAILAALATVLVPISRHALRDR